MLSPVERVTSVWDPDPINVSICRPKANFSPAHVVSNFFVFSNALCLERYLEKRVEGGCLSTLWYCKQTNFMQNTRVSSFNERSSFLQCCFRNVLFFNSLDTIASFSQLWFLLFFFLVKNLSPRKWSSPKSKSRKFYCCYPSHKTGVLFKTKF